MKKPLKVCMTLLLGSVTMALAQTTPTPAAPGAPATPAAPGRVAPAPGMMPGAPGARPMPPMRDRTDMLARMLNLTDEQKEKVRPILDEEQKKMQEVREQTQAKLKPILTEEQWNKYYRPSPQPGQRLQNIVRPAPGGTPTVPAPAPVPPAPSK